MDVSLNMICYLKPRGQGHIIFPPSGLVFLPRSYHATSRASFHFDSKVIIRSDAKMALSSPDDVPINLQTTVIMPLDYTTFLGTNVATTPLTATLLSSFTQADIVQLVYGLNVTSATHAPSTVFFTRPGPAVSTATTTIASSIPGTPDSVTPSIVSTPSNSKGSSSPSSKFVSPTAGSSTGNERGVTNPVLSPGGVAGIAIGCAILGAIIAAAAVIVCCRRRRRRATTGGVTDHEQMGPLPPLGEKASQSTVVASQFKAISGPADPLAMALPPPRQDRDIVGDFSKLGNSIRNHAQSFFGGNGIQAEPVIDTSSITHLVGRNPHAGHDADDIAKLLGSPLTRVLAVRLLLAAVIIQGLEPSCAATRTLLPPEIAQCMRVFVGASKDMGCT
jgi:hypothetical protein